MTNIPVARELGGADHDSIAVICTSALCNKEPAVLVSWGSNPGGLPFCLDCASKLQAHGDVVSPLASAPSSRDAILDRVRDALSAS
jgi:hypothetical protein